MSRLTTQLITLGKFIAGFGIFMFYQRAQHKKRRRWEEIRSEERERWKKIGGRFEERRLRRSERVDVDYGFGLEEEYENEIEWRVRQRRESVWEGVDEEGWERTRVDEEGWERTRVEEDYGRVGGSLHSPYRRQGRLLTKEEDEGT